MAEIASIGDGSSSNSCGFSTQGQISWTSLVTTAFTTTVGILSRVSAAGVDPYTVVVGQKLGARFRLSVAGRQQMIDALQKLPSFQSIGAALSFGFGVNHLVRIMGRTEEGQLCLALCASLPECYDIDTAAEVLIEMVRTSQAPENLRPSILQWKDLLDVSNGILSTSTFPEHAEKLMALHPSVHGLGYEPLQGRLEGIRGCSSPESLAQALLAIGQVTRGELTSITIVGSADAGWIAAFAEWHFQLSIQITLATDGSILYQSRSDQEDVQILVVYEEHKDQSLPHVQAIGRTYRLIDITILIQYEHSDRYGTASVAGRTPWSSALHSAFGSDFKKLLENRRAFGGAIGCLARIMKAISMAEDTIDSKFRSDCRYYESDSYGRGFIAHLTQWFPELANLRDNMEQEAKHDVAKSFAQYDAYISALKIACKCSVCEGGFAAQEAYCLVLILEVIIRVARMLSAVDLPIPLSPSRLGFEVYYADQFVFHRDLEEDSTKRELHAELGAPFFVLGEYGYSVSTLFDALKLFCGRPPWKSTLDDIYTGSICSNGICAYWSAFERASRGQVGGRVTITTGQIQLNEKSYRCMVDAHAEVSIPADALGWPASLSFDDMGVIVKETTSALRIHLEIQNPAREDARKLRIRPAFAITQFLRMKGLVSCYLKSGMCSDIMCRARIKKERPGYTSYDLNDVEIEVFEASVAQQWILLNCAALQFFVEDECIDCCLAAAVGQYNRSGIGNGLMTIRAMSN